ncbi:MAG: GumC family protein [Verrucomicrobiales bacterium]
MNFQRYLFLLLRYSWLMVLLTGLAVAAAWIHVRKQPKVYASRATLEVESEQTKVLNIQDVKENRIATLDAINTVVQNLTNNTLMLKVAKRIGRTDDWAKRNADGKLETSQEGQLAGSVRAQLTVSLRRNTRLIDIVAEDSDPEKALALADAVVTEFLALLSGDRTELSSKANTFLLEEARKLKEKLEESENKLAKYRLENNAVSVEQNQNIIVGRLNSLSTEVTATSTKRASLEADLKALEAVDPKDTEAMLRLASVAALPQVATLQGSLTAKGAEFAALQERYLELHPKFIAAQTEINELRTKLGEAVRDANVQLRAQFDTFVETEKNLKALLAEQEKKALELDRMSIPYNVLQREVETDRELYETILTRLKETNVTQGLEKTPYRIAEEPLLNPTAIRPNQRKTLTTAALLGLVAAIGLILLIDRLDSSIRTVDQAEAELGLPVLAAIPEMKSDDMPPGGTVLEHAPGSSQAEAFRSLRASISLLGEASQRRIFLVTSAIPSEGKTFSSLNLAAALASQGLSTVLVDADLRRPSLSASLLHRESRRGEEYRGLSDVLSGLVPLAKIIHETSIENLFLVPAGRRAPNPAELLGQPLTAKVIAALASAYDRVIIDSAPINAVSDSLSLAKHVDAVCVVVRFGKTPRRAIARALRLLNHAGASLAGLVMNRMPANRGAAYYYYYYGDPYVKDSVYGSDSAKGKLKRKRKSRSEEAPAA